jgi:hypothetical protein
LETVPSETPACSATSLIPMCVPVLFRVGPAFQTGSWKSMTCSGDGVVVPVDFSW